MSLHSFLPNIIVLGLEKAYSAYVQTPYEKWAKLISGENSGPSFERYRTISEVFKQTLDYSYVSIKPKLLILSTTADWNGALSSFSWKVNECVFSTVSKLKESFNIMYRIVDRIPDLCKALHQYDFDHVLFNVHGDKESMDFGWNSMDKNHIPKGCFNSFKKHSFLYLKSCSTGGGNDSIAQTISDLCPATVIAPDGPVSKMNFLPSTQENPPIPSFARSFSSISTRIFSHGHLVSEFTTPPLDIPPPIVLDFPGFFIDFVNDILTYSGGPFLLNSYLFLNRVSFYSHTCAYAIKILPLASRIFFRVSKTLVLQPSLFLAHHVGWLDKEKQRTTLLTYDHLGTTFLSHVKEASRFLSPMPLTISHGISKYIINPINFKLLMMIGKIGSLWCDKVDWVFSFLPQKKAYKFINTMVASIVKIPGFLLRAAKTSTAQRIFAPDLPKLDDYPAAIQNLIKILSGSYGFGLKITVSAELGFWMIILNNMYLSYFGYISVSR